MVIDEVVAALRLELRTVVWPGETLEALPRITRRTHGATAEVNAFELPEAQADEVIYGELDHFENLGQVFEWKVFSFDQASNLLDRLGSAGFDIGEREAVVLYDLNDGLRPFEGSYPCEVTRIEGSADLNEFRLVSDQAFGSSNSSTVDQLANSLRTGIKGHDGYIARIDGEPVAVGRLYTNPASAFAGLYGGGTRPEYRSLGCYRAVVAARARDAAAAGSRYLLVDAMPTSLPILKRLGFVHVADSWPCLSPRSAKGEA